MILYSLFSVLGSRLKEENIRYVLIGIRNFSLFTIYGFLSIPSRDVPFRPLIPGGGEDLGGVAEFDEEAEEHETGVVGDAGGLLHVVGNDKYRVPFLELHHEFFDPQRSYRVKGGAGLVEKDDLGFHGEKPRNAQALLHFFRKFQCRLMQLVLELFEKAHRMEAAVNYLPHGPPVGHTVHLQTVYHVLINCERKRVGSLEHHTHFFSQVDYVHILQPFVVNVDITLDPNVFLQIVHTVKAAQEGRFPASRRSYESRDSVGKYVEINIFKSMKVAVVEIELFGPEGKSVHYPNFPWM